MLNLSLASLLDQFYSLIWPLLRVTAFMVFSSLFSVRAINSRIRIVIALVLTVFIAMQIEIPRIDPITVEGLEVVFQQIFIGFTMGMIMQIATASTVIAGQLVSAPLLLVGLAVGLVIGIFQAATSINEQTLSFIPKFIALGLTLSAAGGWMINTLVDYTRVLFGRIPTLFG